MAGGNDDRPAKPRGTRRDGAPFKQGNTRADGSYEVGKHRPPMATQFKVGDGRARGRRAPGTKNLMSEWREELAQKIPVNEGGRALKVTKRRALIKSKINRGLGKSDRANEEALRYAELSEKREPGLQADDHLLISAWLERLGERGDTDDLETSIDLDGGLRAGGDDDA